MSADASGRLSGIEIILVILEFLLALGAFLGGLALLIAPDDGGLLTTLSTLARSPFDGFLLSGLVLVLLNGVLPVVVAIGTLQRRDWALWGHLAVGALLVAWIVVQLLMLGFVHEIQLGYAALGVVIGILGGVLVAREEEL